MIRHVISWNMKLVLLHSDTDSCARNLDEEQKNEEDEDYIDPPSKKKDKIDSQLHDEIRNRLLLKKIIKSNPCGYVLH